MSITWRLLHRDSSVCSVTCFYGRCSSTISLIIEKLVSHLPAEKKSLAALNLDRRVTAFISIKICVENFGSRLRLSMEVTSLVLAIHVQVSYDKRKSRRRSVAATITKIVEVTRRDTEKQHFDHFGFDSFAKFIQKRLSKRLIKFSIMRLTLLSLRFKRIIYTIWNLRTNFRTITNIWFHRGVRRSSRLG